MNDVIDGVDELDPVSPALWRESRVLRLLRRREQSIYTRLRSIERDAERVLDTLSALQPALPVFPNRRCGLWYVSPGLACGSCHFKSADGHPGQYSLPVTRPNVHVAEAAVKHGGVVIVDATRRGKSFPDALVRTVPMWCSVLNALSGLVEEEDVGRDFEQLAWEGLGGGEVSVISERLRDFVTQWRAMDVDWRAVGLRKKLRPVFVKGGEHCGRLASEIDRQHFVPVVCVSASVAVGGVGEEGRRYCEGRGDLTEIMGVKFLPSTGFAYVQGAGDDEESWALGLSPSMFWERKDWLFEGGEVECERRVRDAVEEMRAGGKLDLRIENGRLRRLDPGGQEEGEERLWVWTGVLSDIQSSGLKGSVTVIALGCKSPDRQLNEPCRQFRDKKRDVSGPLEQFAKEVKNELHYRGPTREILFVPCLNYRGKPDYKHGLQRNLPFCLRALCDALTAGRNVVLYDDANARSDWAVATAIAWLALQEIQQGKLVNKQRLRAIGFAVMKMCPDLNLSRPAMKQLNRYFCGQL